MLVEGVFDWTVESRATPLSRAATSESCTRTMKWMRTREWLERHAEGADARTASAQTPDAGTAPPAWRR